MIHQLGIFYTTYVIRYICIIQGSYRLLVSKNSLHMIKFNLNYKKNPELNQGFFIFFTLLIPNYRFPITKSSLSEFLLHITFLYLPHVDKML